MHSTIVKTNCKNCGCSHTVDRDEDGGAAVPAVACADPACGRYLCSECPQFECACCGDTFCVERLGREEEPACTCRQTDADRLDASWCRAHGTYPERVVSLCQACIAPIEEALPELRPISTEVMRPHVPEWDNPKEAA